MIEINLTEKDNIEIQNINRVIEKTKELPLLTLKIAENELNDESVIKFLEKYYIKQIDGKFVDLLELFEGIKLKEVIKTIIDLYWED
jgi:hypothetical protein